MLLFALTFYRDLLVSLALVSVNNDNLVKVLASSRRALVPKQKKKCEVKIGDEISFWKYIHITRSYKCTEKDPMDNLSFWNLSSITMDYPQSQESQRSPSGGPEIVSLQILSLTSLLLFVCSTILRNSLIWSKVGGVKSTIGIWLNLRLTKSSMSRVLDRGDSVKVIRCLISLLIKYCMSDFEDGYARPASFPSTSQEKFLGGRGDDIFEPNFDHSM